MPLTVLYPIADTPHRIATVPGSPPLLDDDSLAASFAPTGRLGGLVGALAQRAPAGSHRAGRALPGHRPRPGRDRVRDEPGLPGRRAGRGPDRGHRRRRGRAMAHPARRRSRRPDAWSRCPTPTPTSSPSPAAAFRDSASRALGPGRQILSTLLQTPVSAEVAWPADGRIDDPTLDVVRASGASSVLLSADAVTGRAHGGVVPLAGRPVTALLTDPLLTRAATAPPPTPVTASPGAAATAESLAGDDGPLATQDLIGTLAYRAGGSTPLVVAPPHQWRTGGAGARALLDAVGALITAGEVNPVGLADGRRGHRRPAAVRPDSAGGRGRSAGLGDQHARRRLARPHRSAQRRRRRQRGHHGRPALRTTAVRAAARGIGRLPVVAPLPRRTPPPRCWRASRRSATRSGCWSRPTRTRWAPPTRPC